MRSIHPIEGQTLRLMLDWARYGQDANMSERGAKFELAKIASLLAELISEPTIEVDD